MIRRTTQICSTCSAPAKVHFDKWSESTAELSALGWKRARDRTVDASSPRLLERNRDRVRPPGTRKPARLIVDTVRSGGLGDLAKRDDGQVLSTAAVLDDQFQNTAGSTSNQRVGRGARRAARPTVPRLETRPTTRGESAEVDLVGCPSAKSGVRAIGAVPGNVLVELARERGPGEGNDGKQARALVLQ